MLISEDMDIHQLRSFLVLANLLHFRKAAEALNMTQSALSQQMAKLEREYDLELFHRTSRAVSLTSAGRLLQRRGRKLVADYEKLDQEMRSISERSSVRLGYLEYQNLGFVHRTVRNFSNESDKARLEVINVNAKEIVQQVIQGEIDLGITHLPVDGGDLMVSPLLKGEWGFIVPSDHPCAEKPRLTAADVEGEKLILFKRDLNPTAYDTFIKSLKGRKPKVSLHITQSAQGPQLVKDRAGLFLVASYVVQPLAQGLVFKPYTGLGREIQLGLIWRKRPKASTRLVIDELKRQAKSFE